MIDAHVHFWDRGNLPYPWLDDLPAIAGVHRPATLREEAGSRYPDQIVFVECGAPADEEVRWVEELAVEEPRIAAIVAKAAVDAGPATAQTIAELAARPLVRGVRHLIQAEPDPRFCLRPAFVDGVTALGAAGLSFDLCCRHHQLASVVELVRRCPGTRFILDHAGKPDIAAGRLDPWRGDIEALAALPNVDCKFSGLITEADLAHWKIDDLRPFAAHLLQTFGPHRLLFGGDWPVVKLAGTYARWLDTARALVADLPDIEQHAIFHANARRVYRLP